MTTAESIMQEYLDRGYSLDALRLLAESKPAPERDQMLAAIESHAARLRDIMPADAATEDSGPCETAAYPVVPGEEDMLLFVAGDEEEVSDECTQSVADNESVAEIIVGETAGAELMPVHPAQADHARERSTILTRIWSRVAAKAAPAMTSHLEQGDHETGAATDEESSIADVAGSELVFKTDEAGCEESSVATVVVDNNAPEESDILGSLAAGDGEDNNQVEDNNVETDPVAELPAPSPEAADDKAAEPSTDLPVLENAGSQSEMSADYLPGSISDLYEDTGKTAGAPVNPEEAKQALIDAQCALTQSAPEVAESAPESVSPTRESRKERRRRERARKKKEKASAKNQATMPEIVLTRSEGTETLHPEPEPVATDEALLPAPVSEIQDETLQQETPECAVPPMSEPMSLLTPNDFLGDDSDAEELLGIVPEEGAADASAQPGDHLMIIANGGVAQEEYAHLLPKEDAQAGCDAQSAQEDDAAYNVILFNEKFPVFSGVRGDELDETDDDTDAVGETADASFLRMLPPAAQDDAPALEDAPVADLPATFGALRLLNSAEPEAAEPETGEPETAATEAAPEEAAPAVAFAEAPAPEAQSDIDRSLLFRALYGAPDPLLDAAPAPDADAATMSQHTIVAPEPESTEEADILAREAALRAEMEMEYQGRLDEFATRILQVQTASAADAERLRNTQAELEARSAVIEEMRTQLEAEAGRRDAIAAQLAEAGDRIAQKDKELAFFSEMKDEHARLYTEFEDLRKGYNEIVSDVLPKLQGERDDLALTVERQCTKEEKLRSSLGSVRRRMAVGYSLAGAACLALCALPVANWIKSDRVERESALERQKFADLQETLQREVQNNIVAKNTIVELTNKVNMARAQLTDLSRKNQELALLSAQRKTNQDVAVFKPLAPPSAGIPARASEMALQATTQPGGRLHVNQVRDPSGSMEELAMQNRQIYQERDSLGGARQFSQPTADPRAPIALSTVARRDPQSSAQPLRPTNQVRLMPPPPSAQPKQQVKTAAAPTHKPGEITAKVKKGEGVAQVVYRVLGTWDPEIIAWVVKENKLTTDKRGNPTIHPNQTLRLPQSTRSTQSASR